mgnify:CR=1 FL=1
MSPSPNFCWLIMATPTKKVAFHTLGCKLNFSETSTISREFQKNGFEKVKFNELADFSNISNNDLPLFTSGKLNG